MNDFGGNLGGAILKDKLFYFVSMAIQKQPSGNSGNASVLTSGAQTGLFRYAANPSGVNLLSLGAGSGFASSITSTTASGLG